VFRAIFVYKLRKLSASFFVFSGIVIEQADFVQARSDVPGVSRLLPYASRAIIITTGLAGGLLCGYKPLFPACL
jgi:hypothetical protein